MATAQKCYSIACVRPATHRVRGVLGGDVTPKDYCEPCAQQYAAVSVALGAGAEVTPIEPPAPEPAQGADGEVAAKSAVERLREAIVPYGNACFGAASDDDGADAAYQAAKAEVLAAFAGVEQGFAE